MSDLEHLAKPILGVMILPKKAVTLTPDEQVVIVAWLWKMAVLHESMSQRKYFTKEERECLQIGDDPPAQNVAMWLGYFGGGLDANLRGGPARFTRRGGHRIPGFLMSMSLRRFSAQVLAFRPSTQRPVRASAQCDFSNAEVQIWPPTDRNVEWPPLLTMYQRSFDLWHKRWNAPRRKHPPAASVLV
jgi:hypothetical protein